MLYQHPSAVLTYTLGLLRFPSFTSLRPEAFQTLAVVLRSLVDILMVGAWVELEFGGHVFLCLFLTNWDVPFEL